MPCRPPCSKNSSYYIIQGNQEHVKGETHDYQCFSSQNSINVGFVVRKSPGTIVKITVNRGITPKFCLSGATAKKPKDGLFDSRIQRKDGLCRSEAPHHGKTRQEQRTGAKNRRGGPWKKTYRRLNSKNAWRRKPQENF
jgi:hypothetical protein